MNTLGLPKQIASLVPVLAALALAVAFPAAAGAATEEGNGTLKTSPDPIVLAPTTVGYQSAPLGVQIGYQGEGEVSIDKVTLQGAEPSEFFFSGSDCGNLSDGGYCEASVGLKPSAAGEKHAMLTVSFNGPRPQESFEVSGRGVEPSLSFTPASHDFGLQRLNREATSFQFTLENSGEAGVEPNGFDTSGPGQEVFWIQQNNCWTWLEPGASCTVEVRFGPRARAAYEAEARVWVNGTVFTAAVSGEGGAAQIEALENPVDFGTATVGAAGPVRTITLRNSGDLPEAFFIGVLAGGDAASFRLLDEHCTLIELGPGDSCTARVRFTPDSAGPKAARVAFFGDGEGGAMVQVEGEGVPAAATLAPASFDFGTVVAGSRSVAHQFVVRNEGGAALALDRVTLTGADIDQFALSGDECTGAELAPGAQCAVRVRFAPDGSGARQATLRVSGPAATLTAALAGTAVSAPDAQPATPEPVPHPRPRAGRHRHRLVRGETLDARRARSPHRKGKHRHRAHRAMHTRSPAR